MKISGLTLTFSKIFGILISSGIVMGLTFYATILITITGGEIPVPDLHGLSVAASTILAGESGLHVETVGERYDPQVPAGQVISQTPKAGAGIKANRKLKVVVSLGTVPLRVLSRCADQGSSGRLTMSVVRRRPADPRADGTWPG